MLELLGMSDASPAWVRGMWMSPTLAVVHGPVMSNVSPRRHRPSWITMGILVPTGTLGSVKVPSKAVVVETNGLPETSAWQAPHEAPLPMGARGAFGT